MFYKLYKLEKIIGYDETPEHTTVVIMSLFEFLNLLALYVLTSFRTYITSSKNPLIEEKIFGVIIYLLLGLMNYLLCVRKGKYLKIEKRFRIENRKQRIIGTALVSLYILLTVLLTFYATSKSRV